MFGLKTPTELTYARQIRYYVFVYILQDIYTDDNETLCEEKVDGAPRASY